MIFQIAATMTIITLVLLAIVIKDEIVKKDGASLKISYIMMASMSAAWIFWIVFLISKL